MENLIAHDLVSVSRPPWVISVVNAKPGRNRLTIEISRVVVVRCLQPLGVRAGGECDALSGPRVRLSSSPGRQYGIWL